MSPWCVQVLLDKFEHGSARGAEGKVPPPWSSKMLAYLALLSLRPPTSSEQVSKREGLTVLDQLFSCKQYIWTLSKVTKNFYLIASLMKVVRVPVNKLNSVGLKQCLLKRDTC